MAPRRVNDQLVGGSERLERERLPPDRCLGHQALRTGREHAHPVGVLRVRTRAGLERDRRRLGGELEFPVLEVVQRGPVLERDDLRERLAPECQADRRLRQVAYRDERGPLPTALGSASSR